MSKIIYEYQGNKYTLEFTRRSVKQMEAQGFRLNDITEKPMTAIPALFRGAFYAHHKNLRPDLIDEMFDSTKNKMDLIEKLSKYLGESYTTLTEEPAEDEGNATWTEA